MPMPRKERREPNSGPSMSWGSGRSRVSHSASPSPDCGASAPVTRKSNSSSHPGEGTATRFHRAPRLSGRAGTRLM